MLRTLGITLEPREIPVPPGSLLVANHVSWLDVLVLSASLPPDCRLDFVAKEEIRRWPLIGWLLARHGCLFVNRRVGRHLLGLNALIGERLARGRVVVFFPEGTTSDGAAVLPFRPALFEPAARGGHPLWPIALEYRDCSGSRCEAAAFVGAQSLWQSLLAIASARGIVAHLQVCPPIASIGLTRRDAARLAQAAVVAARLVAASRATPAPTRFAAPVPRQSEPAPAHARARC